MKPRQTLFIDTSAFIALRVSDDQYHSKAQHFLKTIQHYQYKLHTSNFILDEVYTYFCKYHTIAIEMGRHILDNPLITLDRIIAKDEQRAWEILQTFKDKTFSYTDATSFALMERLEIDTVFTFDKHFEQYGKFEIVP